VIFSKSPRNGKCILHYLILIVEKEGIVVLFGGERFFFCRPFLFSAFTDRRPRRMCSFHTIFSQANRNSNQCAFFSQLRCGSLATPYFFCRSTLFISAKSLRLIFSPTKLNGRSFVSALTNLRENCLRQFARRTLVPAGGSQRRISFFSHKFFSRD